MRIARLIYAIQMPVSTIWFIYTHGTSLLSYHHTARMVVQHNIFSRYIHPAELSKNLSGSSGLYQHLSQIKMLESFSIDFCSVGMLVPPRL